MNLIKKNHRSGVWPAAPGDAEREKPNAYDDGVAEDLASSVKAAKNREG